MKRIIIQTLLGIIYIALIAFFISQCLKTGTESSAISNEVTVVVADAQEKVTHQEVVIDENYKTMVRKIVGHFLYFVVLGFVSVFFYYMFKTELKVRFILHYSTGFIFAVISEFILQASTEGRSPSFKDVMIDYGGFLILSTIVVAVIVINEFITKKQLLKDI